MKQVYFIVVLFCILGITTSCEKSDANNDNPLMGTWNLSSITGGFTGNGYPAHFDAIRFNDSNLELLKNKAVLLSKAYTVNASSDTLFITNGQSVADAFFNQHIKKISIEKETKLVLTDPCCDLYQYEFTKSKD